MKDYQQLQRRFELAGGYHYRTDLEGVLAGLGLPGELLDRPLLSTSGGELTRVTLARALLADADLLLLDEPTNHLDIDSVEWLEQYLLDYPKAYVLVTHDRRLLERVGSRVLALEHGVVATVGGDFATYMRERAAANDARRPPLRAGQGEDRAAPALLRPLPRQEAQGQAGQGQAHPDRAHQARHEGAARATRAACTWACRSRRPRRASCSS